MSEGWTLHRIVSITSLEGLAREHAGLDVFDHIPKARVEIRAVVVDAMPVLAPLLVGDTAAFLSAEDDRDFGAAHGLEFRSPEGVDLAQRYFDLLWHDPRAIRIRSSAAGAIPSGLVAIEAELRASIKYRRHREENGLSTGDAERIETYLAAERRFEAEKEVRRAIDSLRGTVLWYEAHHAVNSLDALYDALNRRTVKVVRILSGDANIRQNAKRTLSSFNKFADEMAASDISAEWRVTPAAETRRLHGRVLLGDDAAISLPPYNSVLLGTVDAIRTVGPGFDRTPYLEAWESAEPLEAWRTHVGS